MKLDVRVRQLQDEARTQGPTGPGSGSRGHPRTIVNGFQVLLVYCLKLPVTGPCCGGGGQGRWTWREHMARTGTQSKRWESWEESAGLSVTIRDRSLGARKQMWSEAAVSSTGRRLSRMCSLCVRVLGV